MNIDLSELARVLTEYELGTLAGLINLTGILGFIGFRTASTLIDRIGFWGRAFVVEVFRFLAAMRGVHYSPVAPARAYPPPHTWTVVQQLTALILFVGVCIVALTCVYEVER